MQEKVETTTHLCMSYYQERDNSLMYTYPSANPVVHIMRARALKGRFYFPILHRSLLLSLRPPLYTTRKLDAYMDVGVVRHRVALGKLLNGIAMLPFLEKSLQIRTVS